MFQDFINPTHGIFIFYYYAHMKMKKILLGAFLGMFALAGVATLPNHTLAQNVGGVESAGGVGWGGWDDYRANPGSKNLVSNSEQTGSQLLTSIRSTINWLLWILATIALAICLYAGFLMVTSAGDEKKYSKGMTILKYAAIGLVIIGISWLFVSVIFRFINLQWWGGSTLPSSTTN